MKVILQPVQTASRSTPCRRSSKHTCLHGFRKGLHCFLVCVRSTVLQLYSQAKVCNDGRCLVVIRRRQQHIVQLLHTTVALVARRVANVCEAVASTIPMMFSSSGVKLARKPRCRYVASMWQPDLNQASAHQVSMDDRQRTIMLVCHSTCYFASPAHGVLYAESRTALVRFKHIHLENGAVLSRSLLCPY